MIVEAEAATNGLNSEDAIRHKKGAQEFKPCVCSGRNFSCNCGIEEGAYVPGCIVWQRSNHCLVR